MSDAPATRLSLLVRLRDARDDGAWSQFVELYAPLVFGLARKHGLQDADAADLTQDVLQAVSGGIQRLDYDPRRGTFRGWLFTVARNKLRNFLAARRRPGRAAGDAATQQLLQELPAREEGQAAWWDREYERRVFSWAAGQARGAFRESTWQAFWQTAAEGHACLLGLPARPLTPPKQRTAFADRNGDTRRGHRAQGKAAGATAAVLA